MRRARPEQTIQAAIIQHLAWRGAPGLYAFHVPNGGFRTSAEGAILKATGVRRGTPDVIAIHRGQVFALEIKTENGRATAAQLQAIEDIRRAGGHAEICHGLDRALDVLQGWGLLKKGRVQ